MSGNRAAAGPTSRGSDPAGAAPGAEPPMPLWAQTILGPSVRTCSRNGIPTASSSRNHPSACRLAAVSGGSPACTPSSPTAAVRRARPASPRSPRAVVGVDDRVGEHPARARVAIDDLAAGRDLGVGQDVLVLLSGSDVSRATAVSRRRRPVPPTRQPRCGPGRRPRTTARVGHLEEPGECGGPGPSNLAGFTRWVCTSITPTPATVEAGVGGGGVDLGLGRERVEAAAGHGVDGPAPPPCPAGPPRRPAARAPWRACSPAASPKRASASRSAGRQGRGRYSSDDSRRSRAAPAAQAHRGSGAGPTVASPR